MKVVKPIAVTDATLISSTIQEPDTASGEVEFVPDRRDVGIYDKNSVQPDSNFRNVAYVSNQGYYVLTNGDIEHYDEDFNFVRSRGVDSPLGSRERIFSSYDPESGLSSGVYVLYRDSGDTFYTLATYEYDLGQYTRTVSVNPSAGNLSNKEFGGSIAGGPETFTIAMRDQNPSPSNTPMTFYEFKYEGGAPTKTVDGQQSIWDLVYRYDIAYTNKGVAIMGFSDSAPGQDFITDIFFLTESFTTSERLTLSLRTEYRSNIFVWNGVDFQFWCSSTGFGAPYGDFVVESYDSQGVTKGAYTPESRVIKSSEHRVYQCAIKTSEDPVDGVTKVPPTWVEVGPTNKWAMFDYKKSTQSKPSGQLDVELTFTNTLDSVSVFDMESVDTVKIIATSASSGEVFNKTYSVSMDIDLVVLDVPPFDDLTLNLTFTGTDMLIGEVVIGHSKELGVLLSGVVSDRIDYSRTKYDDFGELEYVPRPLVRYTTYPVRISKANAPSIERYLDALKGTQAVWVGDIGNDDLITTFGNIERSPMTYDNPSIVEYQIKVRGSI